MEHLSFVIWVICYPIACVIIKYISTKEKLLRDGISFPNESYVIVELINIIIFIIIAIKLY